MGVHHVDLVVSSIERSLPFYRELLGPLGWHRVSEVEGERGETIWYLAVDERADWVRANGMLLESEPQEYTYSPGYYAVFFYDPDGLKLEILHTPAHAA
jgi:glyoxylase I family protein